MQEAEIADVAQQIRAAGWSQGDLIGPEHAERLCNVRLDHLASGCSDTTFLVVLTQDCDLVRDLDVEPYVELLVLRELPREPQPSTRGQSSRNLHLRGERPGILSVPNGWFAASMHDRFRVPNGDGVKSRTVASASSVAVYLIRGQWMTEPGRKGPARRGCCAAVPGSTSHGSRAPPSATGPNPAAGTT